MPTKRHNLIRGRKQTKRKYGGVSSAKQRMSMEGKTHYPTLPDRNLKIAKQRQKKIKAERQRIAASKEGFFVENPIERAKKTSTIETLLAAAKKLGGHQGGGKRSIRKSRRKSQSRRKSRRRTKRKRGGGGDGFINSEVLKDTIEILKESTDRTIETVYEEIILRKKDADYEEIVKLSTTSPDVAFKIFKVQFLEKYGSLMSKVNAILDSISVIDNSKTSYKSIEQILEQFNNKRNIILSSAFPYPEIKRHLTEPLEELRTKTEREEKLKRGREIFKRKMQARVATDFDSHR